MEENQKGGSMRKTQRAFAGFGNEGRELEERVASKCWKTQENRFSPRAFRKECSLANILLLTSETVSDF